MSRFWILQEDCISALKSMPSDSVDLLITDPAYESLEKHRAIGTTTRLQDWFEVFENRRYVDFFDQVWRIMRNDTHAYVFTDFASMRIIRFAAESVGFHCWKAIVWNKGTPGMGYHYRAQCEFVLFFEKGKRALNSNRYGDVLTYPRPRDRRYPTQKPIGLLRVLTEQSSERGDVVIDPFMGSGSTGIAAMRAGRDFIGIDTSPRAHVVAQGWFEEHGHEVTQDPLIGQMPLLFAPGRAGNREPDHDRDPTFSKKG